MHVTVDGRRRDAPQGPAWTEATVAEFIDRAVLHAGMLCISGPRTKQFEGRIYGIAILAESHVAAHLDLLHGEAYLEMSLADFLRDGSSIPAVIGEGFFIGFSIPSSYIYSRGRIRHSYS